MQMETSRSTLVLIPVSLYATVCYMTCKTVTVIMLMVTNGFLTGKLTERSSTFATWIHLRTIIA